MNYNFLRTEIVTKSLSVNVTIKLSAEFQPLYFEYTRRKKCELTILHLAICLDDEPFVDYLLMNNADVRLSTENVGPVIYTAIRLRKLKYVHKLVDYAGAEFLISRGAEVNYEFLWDGPSPLSIAAGSNNLKMMKLLMKYGADINFVDESGYHDPPLFSAITNFQNFEAVKFLISQPTIRINYQDEDQSLCLHILLKSEDLDGIFTTHDTILESLLDAGIDVNLKNGDEQLAIEMETEENRVYIIKIKQHIVKLMTVNFYVSAKNANAVSGTEFQQLRVQCAKQVEILKITSGPISGFSYYDLLHKCQHKLTLRFKDGDGDKFDEEMRRKFDLYEGMIAHRLEKASQRRELFIKVENVLYEIFNRKLPATFIHDMFFYLSNDELFKLSKNN
ncbi:Similar to ASB2: Ankyrin repeat and SOCS box protein 2 (Bos taurus) [Cotesia congregata]|uniref:Similar to ASB2: Ankyrin repeat and SOCS box protein 2 (Bos taurus) n=1 Tax=Cotesia congregata TaxID=51543 RepID=A0A8J2H7X2_COTCN|nr:Similar to ASB2: Ankyrin repeat and SOCS box protein 2 (Bos taurus) [Cotesia congregata]